MHKTLEYQTDGKFAIRDITDDVAQVVKESGIQEGFLNVQTKHTTAAVVVQENEPCLWKDITASLERLAPEKIDYWHNNFDVRTDNMHPDECKNGDAHIKALFLSMNALLNVVEGKIDLGPWQKILFIELDQSRPREVSVLLK